MGSTYRKAAKTVGLLMLLTCAQCGGKKGKSNETTLTATPEKPIVITADTVNNGQTVKAPWFKFALTLTNNSDTEVTVVALEVTVTSVSDSGFKDTVKAFDPSAYNTSISVGGTSTTCTYNTFGTIEPGTSKTLQISNDAAVCPSGTVYFVVPSVPVMSSSPNFHFRVKARPLGWFGTIDQQLDRYDRSLTFSTQ